ncbi:hypothetical protein BKA66DRAFT_475026 [Pyrenochaeta sp. MPI-SDFR-AT-0127]|nr:hypothetical protein BKA66DRAFT_475026 [Pyrenochaeta sp. MPI-SDFR-AT-0127]
MNIQITFKLERRLSSLMLTQPTFNMSSATTTTTTSPTSTSSDSVPAHRKSRVSAEHTLSRVRENQRRHRARQRDHVASLEQKLAETERLLAEARAEIAALKAEQAAANAICRLNQMGTPQSINLGQSPGNTMMEDEGASVDEQLELASVQPHGDPHLDYPHVDIPNLSFLGNANSPSFIEAITNAQISLVLPTEPDPLNGPPPCCSDPPSSPPPDEPTDPECSTCKMRPPPDPSESTTLCAQAYVMISQQNFRNLDPETIRIWLAQGLRRAQREGEGCRVENGALLRLLDYISGL